MNLIKNIRTTNTDFLKCGVTGWCLEVLWTGFINLCHNDKKLSSKTSLIMFPIYGMAAFIKPLYKHIKDKSIMVRGSLYTLIIYAAEYTSGSFLKKHNMCPWDYSKSKYNINGIIRLDYAPAWFAVGLLYEKLLNKQ